MACNISIQEQEIMRREKELDSKVKKPPEAEKYRLEKIADAERQKVVLEAVAEAEATALRGEAEAYAIIEVKAKAEAEQMVKKAEAWNEYKEAALVDMMLKVLPKVTAEVAGPISETLTRLPWCPLEMDPFGPAWSPMKCLTSWAACRTPSRR